MAFGASEARTEVRSSQALVSRGSGAQQAEILV